MFLNALKLMILVLLYFILFLINIKLKKCATKHFPKANDVDNLLSTLKFVSDWFVTSKMIKKLYNALFADDDILFFDEDSGNDTFSSDEIGILSAIVDNINTDGANV